MSSQKMFYHITKNEEHTIKNKTNKTGKELETTYCLGCKDFTHNFFRPQGVKMTNNDLREKSNCVICQSNKSRFSKQNHSNKK